MYMQYTARLSGIYTADGKVMARLHVVPEVDHPCWTLINWTESDDEEIATLSAAYTNESFSSWPAAMEVAHEIFATDGLELSHEYRKLIKWQAEDNQRWRIHRHRGRYFVATISDALWAYAIDGEGKDTESSLADFAEWIWKVFEARKPMTRSEAVIIADEMYEEWAQSQGIPPLERSATAMTV